MTWVITHIKKAGLLESHEKRGSYGITDEGRKLLTENPSQINVKRLRGYASYRDFVHNEEAAADVPLPQALEDTDKTPEEIMGMLESQLYLQLADELVESICHNSPAFFEALVVDLLFEKWAMAVWRVQGK